MTSTRFPQARRRMQMGTSTTTQATVASLASRSGTLPTMTTALTRRRNQVQRAQID